MVWGHPEQQGTVQANIGRCLSDRRKMEVAQDESRGKHAVTHYEVVERFDYLTLLKVKLETGRTHQIRVHMSHIGHPIFCDELYGGRKVVYGPNTGFRKKMISDLFQSLNRQFLHAKTLGFIHPTSGEK
ncbi:RluA family pseudouridine synthase, partial [Arthrospira platensis SPKY1]|nr:RluA family pseudouridine synthase [Arthrospira platensis SPKY1]